jgi:hypothetical protein
MKGTPRQESIEEIGSCFLFNGPTKSQERKEATEEHREERRQEGNGAGRFGRSYLSAFLYGFGKIRARRALCHPFAEFRASSEAKPKSLS